MTLGFVILLVAFVLGARFPAYAAWSNPRRIT